MLDMMKSSLQVAAGLGETSRRKAMDVARDLVQSSPVDGRPGGAAPAPDAVVAQVAAVADELLALGRQNRRALAQFVRTETEAVLSSLGARTDPGPGADARAPEDGLEEQLRALQVRVDDLERRLHQGDAGTTRPPAPPSAAPGRSAPAAGRARTRPARSPAKKKAAPRADASRTTSGQAAAPATEPSTTRSTRSARSGSSSSARPPGPARRPARPREPRVRPRGDLMSGEIAPPPPDGHGLGDPPGGDDRGGLVQPPPDPPPTGDDAVDATIEDLADVTTLPLEQQVDRYVGAHRRLQDRLADLDG